MTSAFSKLKRQVDGLAATPVAKLGDNTDPGRRNDNRIRRAVSRAASQTVVVRFPAMTAQRVVPTYTSHAWSSSYPASGEAISPTLENRVPEFLGAIAFPTAGYTFVYSAATGKLLAYTTAGTEVVATTDLSAAVGTTPILAFGAAEESMDGWAAGGDARLVSATLLTTSSVAASATGYWTIEARVRKSDGTYGGRVGVRVQTSKVGIAAGVDVPLVTEGDAVTLATGDVVLLYAVASNGSTAPLGDVTLTLEIQRQVL